MFETLKRLLGIDIGKQTRTNKPDPHDPWNGSAAP